MNPSETPTMNDTTDTPELCGGLALSDRVRSVIWQRAGGRCARIQITEQDGAIILDGSVSFYHDRQIALACTRHVPGVRRIIDRIRVADPPRFSDSHRKQD